MLKFIFVNGTFSGTSRTVEGNSAGIGREADNQIQVLIGGVSRYHARFEYENGSWKIRDLGSTNGTKLNGAKITEPVILKERDVVEIGEQQFRILDVSKPDEKQEGKEKSSPFVFRFHDTEKKDGEEKKADSGQSGKEPDMANLFGKKDDSAEVKPVAKSSKRGNLLFAGLVIVVAVFCVFLFFILQDGENAGKKENRIPADHITVKNPFLLCYEKFDRNSQSDEDGNVKHQLFQFKLLIENGKLDFSLDDINGGRAYALPEPVEIAPEALERLKKEILDTRFFETKQQEVIEIDSPRYTRIAVGFDDKFQELSVRDIALSSFDQVEMLIHQFLLREYGLDTSISRSREELIQEMRSTFDLAEKQYNSYKVQPENLWSAIQNYRIAMKCCEVFEKKPEQWQEARKKYAEAQDRLDSIRRDGERRVNLLYQKREFRRALLEIDDLMRYFPPESKTYSNMRELKIKIEKIAEVGQ